MKAIFLYTWFPIILPRALAAGSPPRQQLGTVLCTEPQLSSVSSDPFWPPFFHHSISIYSSHTHTCMPYTSHLYVPGIDTFPSPTDKKKKWKLKNIWGLSPFLYGLVFSNGKTTKNCTDYFCNKHTCINYILLTNVHAISIFRGKCNVSPTIIFNILCFPSIYLDRLFKLWHNN